MFLINFIANKKTTKLSSGSKSKVLHAPNKHHPATKITCLAHGLLLDCQQRNYKMFFRVKQQIATQRFDVITCDPKKEQLQNGFTP